MLATLAITAVSSYAQVSAQKATNKAVQQSIDDEARAQGEMTAEAQRQLNNQAAEELSERAKAANVERARLRVASGEAGAAGASTDALLHESYFNQEHSQANILENLQNRQKQTALDAKGTLARLQSTKNQYPIPTRSQMALKIGSDTAAAGLRYYNARSTQ